MQERAECALLVLQPLDQRDRVVWRTADAVAVFDKPFGRVLARRHDKTRLVVIEVAEIALKPEFGISKGLRAALGDVQRADEAQPRRVHLPPMLGGDIASYLPVRTKRVEAERVGRSDADHAEIVFAGKPSARWGDCADHRDLRIG